MRRPGREPRRPLAFVVRAVESAGDVRQLELDGIDALATLDLERDGEQVDTPLVLVCGHGSRDACCALRGTAVYGAVRDRLGDDRLWISSHQGGHRFAANVLVLPAGIQLGRVEPAEAAYAVERALEGRIELDRYRGRTCYPAAAQAADHAVRAERGLDDVLDLRLDAVEGSVVRFLDRSGRRYAVHVSETDGPAVPASCGEAPEPQRTFATRLL